MRSDRSSLLLASRRVAFYTILSRISGLLRDMLLAQSLGLSWVQDAFNYAFQLPNLFRRLFGEGALASAFVPIFSRTLETEGRAPARMLLSRTISALSLVLTVILALLWLALAAIWAFTPDDPAIDSSRGLLLSLTAVMLPFMVSICILAILGGALNCTGVFGPPALASVVLNLAMLAAILGHRWLYGAPADGDVLAARHLAYTVAVAVLLAGGLQIAFIWPALRREDLRPAFQFEPGDKNLRDLRQRLGPTMLSQGAVLVSTFLDAQACILLTRTSPEPATGFESILPLEEGALSALTCSQRLYQFPLGVLVISIATVALPAFSRMAAKHEWPEWARSVRSTMRLAVFEGLLASVGMIVLAEPIIRLLFEYQQFGPQDTARAARALAWYGLGMWAFCAQHIVLRAFYSLGDVRTPLRITCVLLPINLGISLTLVWAPVLAEAAFAVATTLTSSASVITGLLLLRRNQPAPILDRETLRAMLAMLCCTAITAGITGLALWSARQWAPAPEKVWARCIETFGLLGLSVVVFLAVAAIFRLPEARSMVQSVSGRLRTRASGSPGSGSPPDGDI